MGNQCTIADIFVCVEQPLTSDLFFFTQRPPLTSVVFLTLMIHCGPHVDDGVSLFFLSFFLRWSQMLLTQCDFLRSAPNVKVVRISNKRGQTAVMLD